MHENDGARFACIYSDGSMNVLGPNASRRDATLIAIKDDQNETVPSKMTTVATVLVAVIEDFGKPSLSGDGGSRALNDPVSAAKDRALKIAAAALERIGSDPGQSYARDELARVRTLVPEIDA